MATKKKPTRKAEKAPTPTGLGLEYLALSELERWPRNPKLHDLDGIRGSIRRFGFTLPVVIDEGSQRLVAGHGRQEALTLMREAGEAPPTNIQERDGEWMVPVIRGNRFESEAEAERYLVADNQFVIRGGWDDAALIEILEAQSEPDLSVMGFNSEEIDRLVTVREHERRFSSGDPVEDVNEEWTGMPEFTQEDATAFRSIKVHFKDQAAVEAFEAKIEKKLPAKAKYLWFPEMEIGHFADKQYSAEEGPEETEE